MNMYRFRPVKQLLSSSELGSYTTYGIHAFTVTPSGCKEAALIFDISCDSDFVSALADLCTQLQLSPLHLLDVVLDAIA